MTPDEIEAMEEALNKVASDEGWQQRIVVLPTGIKVHDVFTPEELKGYQEQFAKKEACDHCGGLHLRACPRVRRMVWKNSEEISEVEFWRDGQWDDSYIIWPEDVYESAEAEAEEEGDPDGTGEIEA